MRTYKCTYCKYEITNQDELVEFATGQKNKVIKRAHKSCKEQKDKENNGRKQCFEYLAQILEIPTIGKNEAIRIQQTRSKGYSWDEIIQTIRENKQIIKKYYLSHGGSYIGGIIDNSVGRIKIKNKEEQELIIHQEKIKRQMEENKEYNEVITIKSNNKDNNFNIIETEDISLL